jgi:hypothetical protein
MKYTLAWLALALIIATALGSIDLRRYRRMTTHGIEGKAIVTELLPENHQTLRYEYHAGDRTFHGQMQSWSPNPPLARLKVGQPVVIYYDPEKPEDSVLGDPKPILRNELISIALASTILPAFLLYIVKIRLSQRK